MTCAKRLLETKASIKRATKRFVEYMVEAMSGAGDRLC